MKKFSKRLSFHDYIQKTATYVNADRKNCNYVH